MNDPLDCLVIGGGPAGLVAATYLARFRRRVLVLDAGNSRAAWIPRTHNYPGFPDGIAGPELLQRLRAQAERYGAEVRRDFVTELTVTPEGFRAQGNDGAIVARKVFLATGVVDAKPDLPNLYETIYEGTMRLCPICDGFEVIDQAVTVIGAKRQAVRKALFLRAYTPHLTVLSISPEPAPSDEELRRAAEAGIVIREEPILALEPDGDGLVATLGGGERLAIDVLYPALGCRVRNELGTALGAETGEDGCLVTDPHQRTNVPGLYAGGDVVDELNQLAVATGHAAMAATDIHNSLTKEGVTGWR